jgi:CRISPR system Cascade subunit CasE
MHLARFQINPARRGAHKLLGSPQAMHAAVLASFPPSVTAAADHRVLWRVDRMQHDVVLYVLSPERPDFTHLVEQAGWPTSDGEAWQVRPYDGLLSRITDGSRWRFRLRANPVKAARDTAEGGRSKRVPHVTVAQQAEWLVSRADRLGFEIPCYEGVPLVEVTERDRRAFGRGGGTVTLATAQFDGTLEVRDAEVFRRTLVSGIGRAKAYGCGLMTITGSPPA